MARRRDDPNQLPLFGPASSEEPSADGPRAREKHGPRAARSPHVDASRGAIGPSMQDEATHELARRLSPLIHLGTSSWSFPGWRGVVYDRAATESQLARDGLAAYAQHPLLRCVGIDRTFYAPLSRDVFARYAGQTPPRFRFLCKAFDGVTSPTIRVAAKHAAPRFEPSEHFLDAAFAAEQVVAPFAEGLGPSAGPLVFQFTPLPQRRIAPPQRFIDELHRFLVALPTGLLYAVELRNDDLLCPAYAAALTAAGVAHCFNVHPTMPPVAIQRERLAFDDQPAVVVRWMLNRRFNYREAKQAYAPFDRIIDADDAARRDIAELCGEAATRGRPAFVAINNKAEGSAPLTVRRLAEQIVRDAGS